MSDKTIFERKKEFIETHQNDEEVLWAALHDKDPEVQLMTLNFIYNLEILKKIVADEEIDWYVRKAAELSLIELREY